ncbi:COG0750 Predicted membrane-associated Zn-dependent proteases 1 [Burkholderiaceae bacterium]
MITLLAFILAVGGLIVIHEYGHYRVAVACGVKVLRFSIGFGKPLLRWQRHPDATEFVLCALPLGGYVRMLDEREGPVPADQQHLAFNRQRLRNRSLIVVAGPLANLLTAVVLYSAVAWMGQAQSVAQLSSPPAASLAQEAGLRSGQWVQQVAVGEGPAQVVASFGDLRWALTQAALNGHDLRLWVGSSPNATAQEILLPLASLQAREADARLFERIGIEAPWSEPVIGTLVAGGAGDQAGLREGDRVLSVNDSPVRDAQDLRQRIRRVDAGGATVNAPQRWRVERAGVTMTLSVTPEVDNTAVPPRGRIQAYIGAPSQTVWVSHGLWSGLVQGLERTWDVSWMSLQMFGRMLIGEASLKNLSGPLTIADYAGQSASLGLSAYLVFVALVSVSLGVLNLLPLPVLDGGHLMYYLWEAVTGRAVSMAWLERLQRMGVMALLALMSVALFNDVARLLG